MQWEFDDGGRAAAGYRGDTGDCVVRAIAIATDTPYQSVYDDLNGLVTKHERKRAGRSKSSSRTGIRRAISDRYLTACGWTWVPTMHIGSGCTVHLREGELPATGAIIVHVSRHMVAVVDGVLRDTSDTSRGGNRCVYGYWHKAAQP
jgi:hypothetical protein